MWRRNLKAYHSAKNRTSVIRDFEAKFQMEGIHISTAHIKAKMDTLKRRYLSIGNDKAQQKKWKNFKKICAIMEYVPETEDTQEQSAADEVSSVHNERECSEDEENVVTLPSASVCTTKKKPPPRKAKRKWKKEKNSNPLQKPKRRVWALQEEEIFVEVWQKYLQALRSEKKNANVYKNMASDLYDQGIEITVPEIKAKIFSLIRRFRHHQENKNPDKEWVHYATLSELLLPLAPNEVPDNSTHVNDSESWLDGISSPKLCVGTEDDLCLKKPKIDSDDNESDTIIFVDPSNLLSNDTQNTSPSAEEDDCTIVPDPGDQGMDSIKNISIAETSIGQNSTAISPKTELTIEFGQFVTKELNMLSADLLIEAKRQIYNIICVMQIKQLQANKTAQ